MKTMQHFLLALIIVDCDCLESEGSTYYCPPFIGSSEKGKRIWSGIGSVRTIERVLWRKGINNGRTDWGVQINYMVDGAYRSSLTDVRSNI